MIALTARLNERDDQISMLQVTLVWTPRDTATKIRSRSRSNSPSRPPTLQEELESYDKYQRQLEDALDGKTAELIALRR